MRAALLLAVLLTTLALGATACGDSEGTGGETSTPLSLSDEGIVPVSANSELVVGPNRFGLGLLDEDNRPILGGPGTSLSLAFYFRGQLKAETDATFVWAIPDEAGFFVANVEFDRPGTWEAEATLVQNGKERKVRRFNFPVRAEGEAPMIGERAPASENLTADDVPDLSRISTDEEPDPAFYQLTIAEALRTGKPTVVVFATPKFCQTRFCGPILENVKAIVPEFEGQVNFLHIEPYELDANGDLVVGDDGFPKPAAVTTEWHLRSEPWIFVLDSEGVVVARFEGAASPNELRAAIQPLVG